MDRDDQLRSPEDINQLKLFSCPVGWTFRLAVKGRVSDPLPYDASIEMVSAAVDKLMAPEHITEA